MAIGIADDARVAELLEAHSLPTPERLLELRDRIEHVLGERGNMNARTAQSLTALGRTEEARLIEARAAAYRQAVRDVEGIFDDFGIGRPR